MKRPLAVTGFTMLCTLAVFCSIKDDLTMSVAIIASLVVLSLFLLIKRTRQNRTLPMAAFSVFIALMVLFVSNSAYYRSAILLNNREVTVSGSLSQLPYKNNGNSYYIIDTDTVNGVNEKAQIRLSSSSPVDIKPGDRITVKVKTFLLSNGDDEYLDYHRSRQLFLGAYATENYKVDEGECNSLSERILLLRYNLVKTVMVQLPNDYGAVISALVLGDKTQLDAKLSNAFAACGISHLFVVSGLHISIWSMAFFRLARKIRFKRNSASLISILFCIFFMLLTGCNPPVVRAGFMMIVIYLSNMFHREAEPFNSIGLSLIVMLMLNPYIAVSLSLWLSLLATVGILLFYKPINAFLTKPFANKNGVLPKIYNGICSTMSLSVAVTVCTLPVYIMKLRTISSLLLISNYLMVWLGTLCMQIGGVATILLSIGADFIGKPVMIIAGVLVKIILKAVLFMSQFRYALIPVWSVYSKLFVAVCVMVFAVLLIFNISNKKLLRTLCISMATVFVTLNVSIYLVNFNRLQLSVADVGNGTAVIATYQGETAIIGCGGDYFAESSICDIIKAYGVTRVDYLIVPDSTKYNSGASNDIINSYNVGTLYIPSYESVQNYPTGIAVKTIDKSVISLGDGKVQLYVESGAWCNCAQIYYGNFHAVISFSEYNRLTNAGGNLLICRRKIPDGTSPAMFDLVVLSDDASHITPQEYLSNICTTYDNGNISFLINKNSKLIKWRLV